jgi:hypothetical protein
MTDFFQILQREVEPIVEKKTSEKDKADKAVVIPLPKQEKKPVEKVDKKTTTQKQTRVGKKPGPKPGRFIGPAEEKILSHEAINPIWLTLAEAAKIGGVQKKTIKRAIASKLLTYRIVENRYQVEFRSVILYLKSKKKLWNKVKEHGVGQYIEKWIA